MWPPKIAAVVVAVILGGIAAVVAASVVASRTPVYVASAAAEYLTTFADDEQRANGVPTDNRFVLTVVDRAQGAAKIRPTKKRETSAAAIAGVVVLAGAYVAVQLARREPQH